MQALALEKIAKEIGSYGLNETENVPAWVRTTLFNLKRDIIRQYRRRNESQLGENDGKSWDVVDCKSTGQIDLVSNLDFKFEQRQLLGQFDDDDFLSVGDRQLQSTAIVLFTSGLTGRMTESQKQRELAINGDDSHG